jgi:DegV family protein with EDD domain
MIKLFVDSASSITQADKEKYGVEILPLQITLGDSQYTDGVDITLDMFYDALINKKLFPKTSLPSLGDAEESVEKYTSAGYDVIILTMSSGLSGTYNTMKMLFDGNERVRVIDSKSCVGGIKLLVREINKYLDCSLDYVEERVKELIPRIKIIAVPETLEYLHRGGRLSRSAFAVGSALKLKPIITLDSD